MDGKSKEEKLMAEGGARSKREPPISQLNYQSTDSVGSRGSAGKQEHDDNRSVGTASTMTISSYTQSTGGRWQNFANDVNGPSSPGQ